MSFNELQLEQFRRVLNGNVKKAIRSFRYLANVSQNNR